MNRWLISALALGACIGASATAMPAQIPDEIQQIGAQILAEKLGMNAGDILQTSSRYGRSVFDLAPMFSIQHYSHRSSDEIWRLRKSGMGWGNIAKRVGMNPGQFNQMRVRGEFNDDWQWDNVLRSRYHWSDQQIRDRRHRGESWATLVKEGERSRGNRRRKPLLTSQGNRPASHRHSGGQQWHRDEHSSAGLHRGWTKGKGNPHDEGGQIGHGNGRNHGGNGKGHGNGKDKGNGKGDDHGHGNGGGHGNGHGHGGGDGQFLERK